MSDIITTLHPENDADTNLYPNIKKENIPSSSIDRFKLSDDVNALLDEIGTLSPSGTDTSTNILAFTENKGIYVATDNGHWYYWNGTNYADGGLYLTKDGYDTTTVTSSYDLNNLKTFGLYAVSATITNTLLNRPTNITYTNRGCVIKVERDTYAVTDFLKQTFIYANGYTCERYYINGTWTSWGLTLNDVNINDFIYKKNNATDLSSNTDINTLKDFKCYTASNAVTVTLINTPLLTYGNAGCVIYNERSTRDAITYMKQNFILGSGEQAYRYLINNVWGEWIYPASNLDVNGVPKYWKNEIDTSVSSVLTNYLSMGTHNDIVTFITDMHWEYLNAKHSPSIVNEINKKLGINLTLQGGDVLASYRSTKVLAMNEIDDALKGFNGNLLSTYGNHDFNPTSGQYLTMNDLYNLILKRCEGFTETNQTYRFYVDNPSQKIRYITIPTFDDSTLSGSTKTFLHNACDNLTSDWNVVIITHIYWNPTQSGDPTITTASAESMQWLADLKESMTATLIAVLVGHVHRDYDALVASTSGNTNLLVIGFQEDAYATSSMWQGASMTLGTDTEQAISIIQFDMNNNKIYITRCGAGNDREFNY